MKSMKRLFLLLVITVLVLLSLPAIFLEAAQSPTEVLSMRDGTTKVYDNGDGSYSMDVGIESKHYQDEYDEWQDIDTTLVSSDRINWDWEVTKNSWTLIIKDDTSFAVGKEGNWLGFRYEGFGYLDWSTKEYVVLGTRNSVTPVVDGNTITWEGIFGGCTLEYVCGPDVFKDNLYIPQSSRDWLAAHPPSSYGLSNQSSYLVGGLVCDWSLTTFTPETADGTPINWDTAQEFLNSGIYWRNPATDQLVTALPLGSAYSEDFSVGVNLRYRFYKDSDTNYLLFGAGVTELNSLPSGTIILDPTFDEKTDQSHDDWYIDEYYWTLSYASTTDYLRSDTGGLYSIDTGCRFTSSSFPPKGSTFSDCYVQFYVYSTTYDDVSAKLRFQESSPNPTYPTDPTEWWSRDFCENEVTWSATGLGAGGYKNTPSLVNPLNELYGSISSTPTAIAFQAYPTNTVNRNLYYRTYDYGSGYAPNLHIVYSLPVTEPDVQTDAADEIDTDTAMLNGQVTDDGGGTINYYGFVWQEDTDAGDPGNVDPSGPAGSWDYGWKSTSGDYGENPFDHLLDGTLDPDTTYYFRAAAHNSWGWSYGGALYFTTDVAILAPTVETRTGELTYSWDSATMYGRVTDDGGGTPTTYICWGDNNAGTSDPDLWDHKQAVSYPGEGVSYNHAESHTLIPGTPMYYVAYAINVGYGDDFGEVDSFTLDLKPYSWGEIIG